MTTNIGTRLLFAFACLFWPFIAEASVDSYRFLHVTIATPWYLFIFLLGGVLSPFLLMAALVWYSVVRKAKLKSEESGNGPSVE